MSNITDLIITIFEDQIDVYYFTRLISYNVHPGSLTPKIPQSLDRLIFLCQIYFYVLRTIVLYGIMYLYIYNT